MFGNSADLRGLNVEGIGRLSGTDPQMGSYSQMCTGVLLKWHDPWVSLSQWIQREKGDSEDQRWRGGVNGCC